MTTGVGLTVGDSVSTAVVTASGTDVRTIEHPSVLFTAPDGTVQLGDPGTESTGAVRDFLARVGEPAGIEYAGSLTRAEDLVATAMFCLFREASDGLSGTVKVTATHPSDWAPEIVTKLRESLDYMGLGDATLIPESVALAASPESPAHGAALLAAGLALTDEDTSADTESIPVVEAPLHTAYSAVTAVPAAAAASADASPPAETEASAPTAAAKRPDRRPLIIAGVAAAALVVAGGAVAFALTGKNSTAVPSIQDAQTASVTTSTARPTPVAPAVFPTASTQEVAVTTEFEAPIPVAPPPAPVERTSVFVPPPPPTTTTTTTPVITLPSITTVPQTTTTTTAATTTTTPPETTTTTTTTKEPLAATTTTTPVLPALKTPGQ
ncbi:hypothetical protein CJ179_09860 [Rhodococcus sp. ACS1]|uniref:hypothetical protein n=1 Tax=Rhodococcus TaxID=1827 RepID=UPI000BB0D083|nr:MULTISPECIES: hypothetical protein [Rhodococcus]PBC51065.1 hypothetical protein CJ179_09860 [Rhodococcus sp. ACS1]QSE83087.1 hypothetical protein JWS14_30030 [Rhodococcus koreensis]